MPTSDSNIAKQQKKWFTSLREGLERDTGKSLEQWIKVVRRCPVTTYRRRTEWLRINCGIGVNRSDRNKAVAVLISAKDIDTELKKLLKAAFYAS